MTDKATKKSVGIGFIAAVLGLAVGLYILTSLFWYVVAALVIIILYATKDSIIPWLKNLLEKWSGK